MSFSLAHKRTAGTCVFIGNDSKVPKYQERGSNRHKYIVTYNNIVSHEYKDLFFIAGNISITNIV